MCPTFTLIVRLKDCKREFERVIGERSRIAVISGSRAVRDPLGGARPVERPSTVQKYNWRDPLGGARPVERPARPVELSCCKLQNNCPIFLQVNEYVRGRLFTHHFCGW